MSRRITVLLVTLGVVVGGLAVTPGVAAARKVPFSAAGTAVCQATKGAVKFRPGLKLAPSPATAKVTVTFGCSQGTTGQSGVTVTSVKVTGTSSGIAMSCSGGGIGALGATAKWKAPKAKVNPTSVSWAGGSLAVGVAGTLDFSGPAVSGSYAGNSADAHLVTSSGPGTACTSKKGWTGGSLNLAASTFTADAGAFYVPPVPLPAGIPGDVIRSQPVTVKTSPTTNAAANAWRVLYRTTSATGSPIAASGTIIVPTAPAVGTRRILVYTPPTVGNGDQCATSHALTAGTAPEGFFYGQFIAQGWAVAVPDYEGLGTPGQHTYVVGQSEGHAALDIGRAASRLAAAGLSPTAPVALLGYSQGGQAASWAGQQQPTYAPELPLVGVAAGGVPADLSLLNAAANGSQYFGLGASVLIGFDAAYPELDLDSFLTPAARATLATIATQCYQSYVTTLAFQTFASLTTSDIFANAAWQARFAENSLGSSAPAVPVHLFHGSSDTIVVPAQATNLAASYCTAGATVDLQMLSGADHFNAFPAGVSQTLSWLSGRFAGLPAPDTCP